MNLEYIKTTKNFIETHKCQFNLISDSIVCWNSKYTAISTGDSFYKIYRNKLLFLGKGEIQYIHNAWNFLIITNDYLKYNYKLFRLI